MAFKRAVELKERAKVGVSWHELFGPINELSTARITYNT